MRHYKAIPFGIPTYAGMTVERPGITVAGRRDTRPTPPAQYTDFFSLVIRPVIRKITRSAMLVARSAMRSKSWAAQSR